MCYFLAILLYSHQQDLMNWQLCEIKPVCLALITTTHLNSLRSHFFLFDVNSNCSSRPVSAWFLTAATWFAAWIIAWMHRGKNVGIKVAIEYIFALKTSPNNNECERLLVSTYWSSLSWVCNYKIPGVKLTPAVQHHSTLHEQIWCWLVNNQFITLFRTSVSWWQECSVSYSRSVLKVQSVIVSSFCINM